MSAIMIEMPYDPETRVRIAEMRQRRAEEQSIKDAGRYVDISMRNNRLTAENMRLVEQVGKLTETMHAVLGYPVRLMLPEVTA